MKKQIRAIFLAAACIFAASALCPQLSHAQKVSDLVFTDVKALIEQGNAVIIGKADATNDAAAVKLSPQEDSCFYYRLPGRLHGVVRKELWELGKDGAGIAVRFSTDATCIGAKWTLSYNFGMAHMAYTGIKGLDIYTLNNGKNSSGSDWMYCGTAFPNGKNSASVFVRKMYGGQREYLMYLPLYDGIEHLEIGIDSAATFYSPQGTLIPRYKTEGNAVQLPIVVYGTSVTQGGCASRPGMAYPSIISRKLGREVINLGFSGNGRMDSNMADFIAGINASAYIIDCLANCTYETTRDSSAYFISTIALAHPDKPVYLINNYRYPQQFILPGNNEDMVKENRLWYEIYQTLRKKGTTVNGKATGPLKNLRYIDVSGEDIVTNEDTVDGVHLTDKGFSRLAAAILKHL